MTPKIGQFLGRTVLVSIPALFSDGAGRPYRLLGFELHGLWLQSDELNQRLLTDDMRDFADAEPVVFVPFAQIAGVLVPTALAAEPPPGAPQAAADVTARAAQGKPTARQARRPSRPAPHRASRRKEENQPPES